MSAETPRTRLGGEGEQIMLYGLRFLFNRWLRLVFGCVQRWDLSDRTSYKHNKSHLPPVESVCTVLCKLHIALASPGQGSRSLVAAHRMVGVTRSM